MHSKEPIWLSTVDIRNKYPALFIEKKFTEQFINLLFDSNLLRGYYDRKKRQIFILEESWLDLIVHMNYNLLLQIQPIDGQELKISIPAYCKCTSSTTYKLDKGWYSPTELLLKYEDLKIEMIFDEKFISQLVQKGILRGRFDPVLKGFLVLLPSFIELLKYRDYTLSQNMFFFESSNKK